MLVFTKFLSSSEALEGKCGVVATATDLRLRKQADPSPRFPRLRRRLHQERAGNSSTVSFLLTLRGECVQ